MLKFLFKQKMQPIGLDIGHSRIKMIQLSRNEQTLRVEAAEEEKIDRNPEPGSDEWRQLIIELLQKMHRRGGFTGNQVISGIPSDLLKIKSLRLDTDEPEQIEAMLQTEAVQRFGIDPQRDEIRYMVAGNVYQGEEIKNEVLFLGINREHLTAHIHLLEQANLIPVSIDTVPCALFRSFQATLRRREDRNVVSVFADLGAKYTTVIIGRGQEITFVKQIPIAGEQLNQQVASALGIDAEEAGQFRIRLRDSDAGSIDAETARTIIDAMTGSIEDLAHEISLCFKYYAVTFRGKRPAEAVFAGGEAYEAALMDTLRRHLGLDIRVAEPLRGYDLSRADFSRRRNPQMCEWAVAVGLALKGMEPEQEQDERSLIAVHNA